MASRTEKEIERLVVLLVKPSKYDREGFLVQWGKGVLPSNSLAVMYSLTKSAFGAPEFAGIDCRVFVYDEIAGAQRVDCENLMVEHGGPKTKIVVGLVGVQTNQFPRAHDLAREFQALGATVVIGGFHVSGAIKMLLYGKDPDIPCPHIMPPECQELMDEGIVIFYGEAESTWPKVLDDICRGRHRLLYRGVEPDFAQAPFPEYPLGYFDGFFARRKTIDLSRGCPFHCSFCSIIAVLGHTMRSRNIEATIAWARELREGAKASATWLGQLWRETPFFFVTDDNFARHPDWEAVLQGFIGLRREGLGSDFMIEADLASWRLKGKKTGRGFVEMLAQAGCTQVFMGVESVRQETLRGTRKHQNRVDDYSRMCELYHRFGIECHAGYIIGFPADTPETIREDIETLKEIGFDQASFFILTPIPGSEDHVRMYVAGIPMDSDLNKYDSFQPAMDHPLMSREEWQRSYDNAWRQFFTTKQMVAALTRVVPKNYWGLFATFVWYRWSAFSEGIHPMMGGFYRYRRWSDRRPSAPQASRAAHWFKEAWRHLRYLGFGVREFFVFQSVYFETRWLPQILVRIPHLTEQIAERRAEIQTYGREWNRRVRQSWWFAKTFGSAAHRAWLTDFWRRYASLKWKLLIPWKWVWHLRMLPHALTEFVYAVRFGAVLVKTAVNRNW